MRRFQYLRATNLPDAVRQHGADAATHYLAGGTTQLDLMKLDVLTPERVVDVAGLRKRVPHIEERDGMLHLDAFATMAQAAANPLLQARLPMVVEALTQSASHQIRAMATLGGNLLQRTRCGYYRDVSWHACNRRTPGTGCAALEGSAWAHAVLGTSPACIAVYPGDLAQALIALDAVLEVKGRTGLRALPLAKLHRTPDREPQREHNLVPGEIIVGIRVPARPWFSRSRYVKVRDRASYEFALASAAVALDLEDGVVRDARIAVGGATTVPWRAREAEDVLRGRAPDAATAERAAAAAFASANVCSDTRARYMLGQATLVRAVLETAALEMRHG